MRRTIKSELPALTLTEGFWRPGLELAMGVELAYQITGQLIVWLNAQDNPATGHGGIELANCSWRDGEVWLGQPRLAVHIAPEESAGCIATDLFKVVSLARVLVAKPTQEDFVYLFAAMFSVRPEERLPLADFWRLLTFLPRVPLPLPT